MSKLFINFSNSSQLHVIFSFVGSKCLALEMDFVGDDGDILDLDDSTSSSFLFTTVIFLEK